MVRARDAFLIDSSFIVERTRKAFLGTSLLTHDKKDATFTFGFIRDLLRLRQTLGIRQGALVFGREAQTRALAQNMADLVTFLAEARHSISQRPAGPDFGYDRRLAFGLLPHCHGRATARCNFSRVVSSWCSLRTVTKRPTDG